LALADKAVMVKGTVTGTVPWGTGTVACPLIGPTRGPSVMLELASPFASVVFEAGWADPPAVASSKVKSTVTPATGRSWVSVTLTTRGAASGDPTRPLCGLPDLTSMCAG